MQQVNAPKTHLHVESDETIELIPFLGNLHIRVRTQTITFIVHEVEHVNDFGHVHELHRPIHKEQVKRELTDFIFVQ